MIEVEINRGQYQALKHLLAEMPKELPKAITRAINKVAKASYTRILRKISHEYTITQSELKHRKNVTLTRASYGNQIATIKIKGRRIRLLAFKARQVAKGVSYKIKKTSGRKCVYAFMESPPGSGRPTLMPPTSSGKQHAGVFRRKSRKRTPIIELFGPSVPAMFQTTPEFAKGVLERDVSAQLGREIISQAEFIIAQRRGVSFKVG